MSTFIEVSHQVVAGMKTYPGLPEPVVEILMDYDASHERYAGKAEFLISSLHLCGNTGTYVDSPRHRFRGAVDLAGLPLENVADLPIALFNATERGRAIGPELFAGADVRGKAVLVRTDFSLRWGTPEYFTGNPYLTGDAARLLVEAGARFAGIDSLNIDDTDDLSRPAHTALLGAGVPVCEHMANLAALEGVAGRLHAVPIAWAGGATFPVRAYVIDRG